MNYFDSYSVAGPSSVTNGQQQSGSQPSLNEEVQEVLGSFKSFWGGFRKQSESVLQSARKELTDVAGQAQREFNRLTAESTAASSATTQPTSDSESTATSGPANETQVLDPIIGTGSQEAEASRNITTPEADDTSTTPPTATPSATTPIGSGGLFSQLHSAFPQNWLETARGQLPESIRNVDSTQLRSTIVTEFQRVQDVTLAHAEEYAQKGEALFQQAVENASTVLKDAVKVIPPEEQDQQRSQMPPALSWDGGDMWALPIGPLDASAARLNGEDPSAGTGKTPTEGQSAVTSRAELLLLRLKQDPDIIRRDPADDGELGKSYAQWAEGDFDDDGGINGEVYGQKISALLKETPTGEALKNTLDFLVPSGMTEEEFWKRYFFRAHQIQAESEKRKAIIESTLEEEEISWEDDDEEVSTHESATPEVLDKRRSSATLKAPSVVRDSSDDGYDVVSAGTISPGEPKAKGSKDNESSDDSDWE